MADGTTTNQSFVLPEVGASEDTWGTKLNANWSALDTLIGGVNATEFAILDGATVTTAELNILDGVTATASELNALDGITATVSELNILDGVTATAAELNILDGVTATAANLNLLAGATATGTGTLVFGTSPTLATATLTSPVINTAVTGTALASTGEAEAGTATDKLMTPETTAAAIAALAAAAAITTTTLSSDATAEFTWTGTPRLVVFRFSQVSPATDSTVLQARFRIGGAYVSSSGAYAYQVTSSQGGNDTTSSGSDSATSINLNSNILSDWKVGNASGEGLSGVAEIVLPGDSVETAMIFHTSYEATAGIINNSIGSGRRKAASVVDGVQFFFDSGNLASGKIIMEGYA